MSREMSPEKAELCAERVKIATRCREARVRLDAAYLELGAAVMELYTSMHTLDAIDDKIRETS